MTENFMNISTIIMDYSKSLDAEDGKDLLLVTVMPLVCTIIEDLVDEGKIKLC